MDFRPARLIAAGAIVGVGLVGGAVGVMALDGSGTPAKAPVKAVVTSPSTTVAPAPTTVALVPEPGFEDYTPGDELPAPPPAPTPQSPEVETVPGPYGDIYPDGYVDPNLPPPSTMPLAPVRPAEPSDLDPGS